MSIFRHVANGHEYEIRPTRTAEGWKVATFDQGKRILACYTVSFEQADDFGRSVGDPIKALIDAAKGHLDDGSVKS